MGKAAGFKGLVLAGMALATAALAGATPAIAQSQPARMTVAAAGGDALPPIGWVQMCQTDARECEGEALRPTAMKLEDARWRELQRINRAVNDEVIPASDMEQWGTVERWSYPDNGYGDCEDYVLEKRRRLMAAGWSRASLLITVVRDRKGEGHAVLLVKTDRGDFILDNQEPRVKLWSETGYTFLKRQSQEHPSRWVSLGGVDANITTAQR
jgi:predicted transglutaminase-like cysteine proteinase